MREAQRDDVSFDAAEAAADDHSHGVQAAGLLERARGLVRLHCSRVMLQTATYACAYRAMYAVLGCQAGKNSSLFASVRTR